MLKSAVGVLVLVTKNHELLKTLMAKLNTFIVAERRKSLSENTTELRNEHTTRKELATELIRRFGPSGCVHMNGVPHPVISTGSHVLDQMTGIYGIPGGRITEISGDFSTGKSTMALQIIRSAQASGGATALINAEYCFSERYAAQLGVNTKDLVLLEPETFEQAFDMAYKLIASGGLSVLVVDSFPALLPKEEQIGDMGDTVSIHGTLARQGICKILAAASKNMCAVVIVNQLRYRNIARWNEEPNWVEITPGGNVLKFFTSLKISLKTIHQSDEKQVIRAAVTKNNLGRPTGVVMTQLNYGHGFTNGDIFICDLCRQHYLPRRTRSLFSGYCKCGSCGEWSGGHSYSKDFLSETKLILREQLDILPGLKHLGFPI